MRVRLELMIIVLLALPACGVWSGDEDPEAETLPAATTTTTTSTAATTTTTTEVRRPGRSYEAQLLEGGALTIEEGVGALSEFTQDKPTAIHQLDQLAAIPDCEQLGLSIWDWTTKAGPSDGGRKASAFAKHGDNLYKFIGCGTATD